MPGPQQKVFGLTSSGRPGSRGNTSGKRSYRPKTAQSVLPSEATNIDEKAEATKLASEIDAKMGFEKYEAGPKRVGWLINMHQTTMDDGKAAMDYYFLGDDGDSFKASVQYDPYLFVACKVGTEGEVEEYLRRAFDGLILKTSRAQKEDLRMPNHLTGYRRTFIKLTFANTNDLYQVKKVLAPIAESNKKKMDALDAYTEVVNASLNLDLDEKPYDSKLTNVMDAADNIVDLREWDVPYHVRVAIDKDIRVGKWYTIEVKAGVVNITDIPERVKRAEPVVLAFDIETTKLPLKFPDAATDCIMMISYMIDGQGYLITNREIVSQDIGDFDYTPKPEFEGPFIIFNEPDERSLIMRFFEHIQDVKPTVIATFNGDFFDWPFVETRAAFHGISMYNEIGFQKDSEEEYKSNYCAHMDCFRWVKRDSYLPQGSQGLKAVTAAKLGYDPDELDPELMTPYASEQPQVLAQYSVSDAVATYYLYMKYVHPFIFSLCNIIPLNPDDVLRKGTGTLCEMLLMVEAYQKGIILPNKHLEEHGKHYDGHLLESETYVGGHVESLEAGVFRSDIPEEFEIDPTACDELLSDLDAALKFTIEVEEKKKLEDITNYDEVREQIASGLRELRDNPKRKEKPTIYHLDVASMYPNIMITNRLQPDSMMDESNCAACDFNVPGKNCDRRMTWAWRGEYFPAKRDEFNMIQRALQNEMFPGRYSGSAQRTWDDLSAAEQSSQIQKRLSDYCRKVYHKIHDTKTINREVIVCQRENPFYIDTVKSFRDRRYDYKGLQKQWKGKVGDFKKAGDAGAVDEAGKMVILYDSLQLAHKVILNSFYGYVMRKGSRWYSMEMAGVTCLTGATIIQMARKIIERVGRPLELDTDGIWCIFPKTFPEDFVFTMKNGKKMNLSYPCSMLNHLVHAKFTNHAYQDLVDPNTYEYKTSSENSIFFEVDGPYRAMMLPTSKEEDKNLKKRYAVFNDNGSLAELKGFELKRRGELQLIKIFQKQLFKVFLEGETREECYAAVARIANRWLDVLDSKGVTLADEELVNLICENRSMSKTLEEYGKQKSTSITTARRLGEFLGEQMVKDKGLACKYIISAKPKDAPVTERAVPIAIFSSEESVKRHFLRKWLKDASLTDFDLRSILDWGYYLERFGSVIQKLISIPAALQKVENPVPRVAHPEWLQRRLATKADKFKQQNITNMFSKKAPTSPTNSNGDSGVDLEDFGGSSTQGLVKPLKQGRVVVKRKTAHEREEEDDPFASLPPVLPDPSQDYSAWLKYQKQKWKLQRVARQRRRHLFGKQDRAAAGGLSGMFRDQAGMIFTRPWQILHLRESNTPGQLAACVLIEGGMHNVKINVPRRFYVNLKSEDLPNIEIPGCRVTKVSHTLPTGHPSVGLFELEMSEDTYLDYKSKLNILLSHPSVEGVYETKVTPKIRALLRIGARCNLDTSIEGSLSAGLATGFQLANLKPDDRAATYLEGISLKYLYLYNVNDGDRQVLALFSSIHNSAHIVVYDGGRQGQQMPNMEKIYSDVLAKKSGTDAEQAFEYPETIDFTVTLTKTKKKAMKAISDAIKRYEANIEKSASTVLIMDPRDKEQLASHLPDIEKYPVMRFQGPSNSNTLPPLGWQSVVAKRLIGHWLIMAEWVSHRVSLARYGSVPLCDFEADEVRFLTDILYARRLKEHDVVLWWSSGPKADLGGSEQDDALLATEPTSIVEVNSPGAYSTVCVEFDVRNLVVNTILTSAIINDLEGADSGSFGRMADGEGNDDQGESTGNLSENSFSSASLLVLKDMVRIWREEAVSGIHHADLMVQHLFRWIQSTESCLHDPALRHHIHAITKKAFLQLLAELRRVGSKVVFADMNRIIIQTSKPTVGNAWAYADYVVKAIKTKPMFHFLDLVKKEFWDYLLWMDDVNYGGISCLADQVAVMTTQGASYNTVLHWHIKSFLPPAMQEDFSHWVVEFIRHMHQCKSGRSNLTQWRGQNDEERPALGQGVLARHFTKPLKKRVGQLYRRQLDAMMDPELLPTFSFPALPGSHLDLTNPTLEFVKFLSAVYGLAKDIVLEVRMLRKELLALLDVREFSNEATFLNPSETLKFRHVTCVRCSYSCDLDFCRDEELMASIDELEDGNIHAWTCAECHSEYDRLALEEQMIADLHQSFTTYQLQDLRCAKCKQSRIENIRKHCACSGEWVPTMSKVNLLKRVKVYENVASFYKLEMLANQVEELSGLAGFAHAH
ncbi:DNA polymerase epsilon catalytic subunit [Saitoella coloradoensis]